MITGTTAPVDPVAVNTAVTASVDYTDNNIASATFDWGDGGITTEGPAIGPAGIISSSYTYATPGIYPLSITLLDECGETASTIFQYIVIYDPYGGFVTGGGWINSPAGASVEYTDATGKANFGFVSKYKKGATVPMGNTEFQFKAGNLNFKSTSYEWLVVAGSKAKFKGEGTIDGFGQFGFMLTATDGSPDLFRIKIWDITNSDAVVYDNQMGASDDSYSGTQLGGGSIVVHDANGKNARYDNASAEQQTIGGEGVEAPAGFKLNVYPSPLQRELTVDLESETEEEATITVYDIIGRKVYEQKQPVVKGVNQLILDVDSWKVNTDQLLFRLYTPSKGMRQLILINPE